MGRGRLRGRRKGRGSATDARTVDVPARSGVAWRIRALWWRPRVALTVTATVALMVVGLAALAARQTSDQWLEDDWAALVISVALGASFFVLAGLVNREADARARVSHARAQAVADSVLVSTLGALATASARSLAGFDQQTLRIAADARAALKHYSLASSGVRKGLCKSIIDAYSDLAFAVMSRADNLPRSFWNQLRDGIDKLVDEATTVGESLHETSNPDDFTLSNVAAHAAFVGSIGDGIRRAKPRNCIKLNLKWGREHTGEAYGHSVAALERLKTLYRHELTVKHNWKVLTEDPRGVNCQVLVFDITRVDEWYTPWYVLPDARGTLRPVNVDGAQLNEVASKDRLRCDPSHECPHWPEPLKHGHIPEGMREAGIERLSKVLTRPGERGVTVVVLAYDVRVSSNSKQRIVLDGNHRLAAARALAQQLAPSAGGTDPKIRVLTFLLGETRAVTTPSASDGADGWSWPGFTPDVARLREAMGAHADTPLSSERRCFHRVSERQRHCACRGLWDPLPATRDRHISDASEAHPSASP